MIKAHQFEPAFGLPNASPFCMKLETYLRMAGIPFALTPPNMQDMRKAPKGKLPFIDDNGKIIADSTFIINHLKTTHGDTLDRWLSAEQKAVALSFQRLMEDVKQRAILSRLGVETAFNSFHLSVSLFSVLAGEIWSDLYGHDLRNTQALFSTKANRHRHC